jgi:hypothetical protein
MTAKRLLGMSVLAIGLAGVAQAQPFTPVAPYAGGIDPQPVISSVVTNGGGRLKVSWTGFRGGYQVQVSTNGGVSYNTVGTTSTVSKMITYRCPSNTPSGTFRVVAPTPRFNSAYGQCGYCHAKITRNWVRTPHAEAFDFLVDLGQQTNSACLPCHTVGYGLSTGFINTNTTRYFAGVQCENCHGPTGGHAGKYNTPAVTLSATLCGGCHQGSDPENHSIFQEWETAGHAEVLEDIVLSLTNSVLATSQGRMGNCGFCHSGAVRLALLKKDGSLPSGQEASEIAMTCVICHDPHNEHVENGGFHLRNPMSSTNAYNFATSQNGAPAYGSNAVVNYGIAYTNFWVQYNSNVMICAQCHNARGASVKTATGGVQSRPPHHSDQYNILMGNLGVTMDVVPLPTTNTTAFQSPHGAVVDTQCIHCHMAKDSSGLHAEHTFHPDVSTNTCGPCHVDPAATMEATQADISNRISNVVGLLQTWGQSANRPVSIRGKNAWEFQTMGALSVTNNGASPSAANQSLYVSNTIQEARFNLYLVFHDGSLGVHNANYARYLLDVASNKVVNTP